jgi:hypothetical protein
MACGCKKKNTQSEPTQGATTTTEGTPTSTTEQTQPTQPTQEEVVQISVQLREMIEKKIL